MLPQAANALLPDVSPSPNVALPPSAFKQMKMSTLALYFKTNKMSSSETPHIVWIAGRLELCRVSGGVSHPDSDGMWSLSHDWLTVKLVKHLHAPREINETLVTVKLVKNKTKQKNCMFHVKWIKLFSLWIWWNRSTFLVIWMTLL